MSCLLSVTYSSGRLYPLHGQRILEGRCYQLLPLTPRDTSVRYINIMQQYYHCILLTYEHVADQLDGVSFRVDSTDHHMKTSQNILSAHGGS